VSIKNKIKDIALSGAEEPVLEDEVEETQEEAEVQESEEAQELEGGEEIIENSEEDEKEPSQEEPTEEFEEAEPSEEMSVLQMLKDYFKEEVELLGDFETLEPEAQMGKLFELVKEKDAIIQDFENKVQEFDSKLEELKAFKFAADEAEFNRQIEETIQSISEALPEDEISILLEASRGYSLENIDLWKNVALANAYKATLDNKPQTTDVSAPLLEKEPKKNTGNLLW
jgi:hypothetical protein